MSIVYDFPSIASRLRKDGFYDPSPRSKSCESNKSVVVCPKCKSSNDIKPASFGSATWFCNSCSAWF